LESHLPFRLILYWTRLEVVVREDGSVQSAKVLGGNPVLIDAATDAVRKWRFEAASRETVEVVEVRFGD
jgi:TonB family protein